jgi:hypothetical protein
MSRTIKPLCASLAALALLAATPLLAVSSGSEAKLPVRDPSAPAADTVLLDAMQAELHRAMDSLGTMTVAATATPVANSGAPTPKPYFLS